MSSSSGRIRWYLSNSSLLQPTVTTVASTSLPLSCAACYHNVSTFHEASPPSTPLFWWTISRQTSVYVEGPFSFLSPLLFQQLNWNTGGKWQRLFKLKMMTLIGKIIQYLYPLFIHKQLMKEAWLPLCQFLTSVSFQVDNYTSWQKCTTTAVWTIVVKTF